MTNKTESIISQVIFTFLFLSIVYTVTDAMIQGAQQEKLAIGRVIEVNEFITTNELPEHTMHILAEMLEDGKIWQGEYNTFKAIKLWVIKK